MTDIVPFACPITVAGVEVAEVEGEARIVSPFPYRWEIWIEGFSGARVVLDDIQPTDRGADMKYALRDAIETYLWTRCQDAVQEALHEFRSGNAYRQMADAREAAE